VEGPSEEEARQAIPRRWLAPLLVVLLLAVVAVVSAGRRSGLGAHGHGPGRAFYDYLFTSVMLVWGLVGLVLLALHFRERRVILKERRPSRFPGVRLIGYLLLFATLGLMFHRQLRRLQERWGFLPLAHRSRGGLGQAGGHVATTQQLEFRWAPLIVTAVLALVVLTMFAATVLRRRAVLLEARTIEDALAEVMDDALDDIRAEGDPRRAIIAAYARMEKLLAGFGRGRAPSEAPFEYLARVLLELRVSRHPVEALTELFERAKFSAHTLGPEEKSRAIESLESVRDELRDPVAVAAERAPA
jgi:hypothetical protein